jgi:hypothetical protein
MSDISDYDKKMAERIKNYEYARNVYHNYRYEKIFGTVEVPNYITESDLDSYESKYRDFDYKSLKFGKHFLFQTVTRPVEGNGVMSKPIMGTFVDYGLADQALEYKFILPTRTWETNYLNRTVFPNDTRLYDRDIEIDSVIEWSEYIYIFGIWDKYPNWKEMKTAMKESFYYRLSRKDKIDRVLK